MRDAADNATAPAVRLKNLRRGSVMTPLPARAVFGRALRQDAQADRLRLFWKEGEGDPVWYLTRCGQCRRTAVCGRVARGWPVLAPLDDFRSVQFCSDKAGE